MRNLILMFVLITNVIFVQGQNLEIIENFDIIEFKNIKNDNIFTIDDKAFTKSYISNLKTQTQMGKNCDVKESSSEEHLLLNNTSINKIELDLSTSYNKIVNISMNVCLNSYVTTNTKTGSWVLDYSKDISIIFEESYDNVNWTKVDTISNSNLNKWFRKEITYDFNKNISNKIYIRFSFSKRDLETSFSMDDLKITTLDKAKYPSTSLSNEKFLKNNTIVALNDNFLEIKSENEIKNVLVYDSSGKLVKETKELTTDVSGLSIGVYIVRLHDTDNNIIIKKIIKS